MIINVKINPRAKRNLVEKQAEDLFRVYVTAPPEDGKANKAMRELLAEHFGIAKSKISIISGEKFRQKVVKIDL
ncbi:MAG: DUF167 domain-containing protein [Candidatus Omnitrophota bacterium]